VPVVLTALRSEAGTGEAPGWHDAVNAAAPCCAKHRQHGKHRKHRKHSLGTFSHDSVPKQWYPSRTRLEEMGVEEKGHTIRAKLYMETSLHWATRSGSAHSPATQPTHATLGLI